MTATNNFAKNIYLFIFSYIFIDFKKNKNKKKMRRRRRKHFAKCSINAVSAYLNISRITSTHTQTHMFADFMQEY
jgi:hypothetical protein